MNQVQGCQLSGREDGGVVGNWANEKWVEDSNSAQNKFSGWVGSFGPFAPILTSKYPEYFTIYSHKLEQEPVGHLHPYGPGSIPLNEQNFGCF